MGCAKPEAVICPKELFCLGLLEMQDSHCRSSDTAVSGSTADEGGPRPLMGSRIHLYIKHSLEADQAHASHILVPALS